MSEQSTEVKGFKNSALGKVLFKIAAIAGLQEALDGKAADSHTHSSILLSNGRTLIGGVSVKEGHSGAELEIGLSHRSGLLQTLTIAASQLSKLGNAIEPDSAPVASSQKLITSGAVYAAIAEAIDEPAELYLDNDSGGSYYLWGSGEDTNLNNINSVKSFLINNPANITKRCLITHTERAGSSESQDTVTYCTGYARWTKPHSDVYYVELWVPGLHKFLTCSASSSEEDPSDIDADSWDDAWTRQSLS